MKRILFVEDDPTIRMALSYSLRQEGYEVITAETFREACAQLTQSFDLVLLDLSLPDGSGYDICRKLQNTTTPILILSAIDDEANVVMGLELGAVDYVTKPFRLRELLTRIAGILRRAGGKEDTVSYRLGNVYIDALKMKVWVDEKEVSLTALEYRLLLLFLQHPGQVLTRRMILERLWDVDGRFINDNTLTVYIKRIRDKIGDSNGERIRTVRGQGYAAEV